MSSRATTVLLAAALILPIIAAAWLTGTGQVEVQPLPQRSLEELEQTARDQLAGIRLSPTVTSVALEAGSAVADRGGEQGTGLVRVRIVNRLDLQLEIEADRDVSFGAPPQLCLVGPDSAPDDAGLTNPCWGKPDLGDFLAAQLTTDELGHPRLPAGEVIHIKATLWRGPGVDFVARCDYAPGSWTLEVNAAPVVDGVHLGPMNGPDTSLEVPIPSHGPLRLLRSDQTRYCGLATGVYREQGEPPVATPVP